MQAKKKLGSLKILSLLAFIRYAIALFHPPGIYNSDHHGDP